MCPIHHQGKDSRRANERLRLATTRLKIYVWNARSEGTPNEGFGFLADISPSGVGIFLGEKLAAGTHVRLGFETADGMSFRGAVAWSMRYSLEQHFLGHSALSFRMGVRLLFGSEAERQRYLTYQKELCDRALALQTKP